MNSSSLADLVRPTAASCAQGLAALLLTAAKLPSRERRKLPDHLHSMAAFARAQAATGDPTSEVASLLTGLANALSPLDPTEPTP